MLDGDIHPIREDLGCSIAIYQIWKKLGIASTEAYRCLSQVCLTSSMKVRGLSGLVKTLSLRILLLRKGVLPYLHGFAIAWSIH